MNTPDKAPVPREVEDTDPFKPKLDSLAQYGATVYRDPFPVDATYWAQFNFGDALTTVRIKLIDEQTGADLVITNMTTLSTKGEENQTRKGFGSKAIQNILLWAKENNLHDIRATQVAEENEAFWIKNGFVKDERPNNNNDFRYEESNT